MKKIIALAFSLLITSQAFAAVSIVNDNKVYDIDVSYHFCQPSQGSAPKCTDVSTVTVKADDNRVANVSVPLNMQSILIVSAIEKNSSGQIIARGNYETGNGSSHCGYPLLMEGAQSYNVVISLTDMQQTPIIRCLANGY